jgi:hypothetical protein
MVAIFSDSSNGKKFGKNRKRKRRQKRGRKQRKRREGRTGQEKEIKTRKNRLKKLDIDVHMNRIKMLIPVFVSASIASNLACAESV